MKPVRTLNRLIALNFIGGLLPSIALAQTIVWTDGNAGKIQRKDVSGGLVTTIVQFPVPQGADQIHYDPIGRKLYYLFYPASGVSVFRRINLDGSEDENIPTPNQGTFGLNVESRKLYWWKNTGHLYRAKLDGTEVESHFFNNCCIFGLEPHGDTVYFGAGGGMQKGIWRADADGSNAQFLQMTQQPTDLAFDPIENKIYMGALNSIIRINADGSDYQVILTLQTSDIQHLEIDYRGRKLYWVEAGIDTVQRCNLDGTGIEDFVTPAEAGNLDFNPEGLTFVDNRNIPVMSEWGVVSTGLMVLIIGLIVLKKRSLACKVAGE